MLNKIKNILIYSITFLIIITLTLIIIPKKANKKNLTKIKLAEVTHSVFYAPFYVAIENDYFADEGLDIDLILTSGADKVSTAVISGDVQIGFAGAESVIYVYDKKEKDYLQIFGGLTKRDGQFIIGREKIDSFTLNDLKGKEILVGRSSGMPAINFLQALKNAKIDPNDININYNIDFASLTGAFVGKNGDFVNLFEPNALKLEKEKQGYVVASIGMLSNEVPYTTFYAKKSYVQNNKDILIKFNKAIDKGLEFVKKENEQKIAKTILKQFPDTSLNDLTKIVKRYKEADSWLSNHIVSERLFTNLEDMLIDNNLLEKYVPYDKLVLNINE